MEMRYKMSAGLLSPQHIFNEFMCVYVRARGTHLSPALEPALIDNSIVENSMDASDGALSRNGSISHPDTSLWVFGCWKTVGISKSKSSKKKEKKKERNISTRRAAVVRALSCEL